MLATLTFVWGYFRLFETKDRTFGELDIMVSRIPSKSLLPKLANSHRKQFQKGVSARKSAKYVINNEEMFMGEHIVNEKKEEGGQN